MPEIKKRLPSLPFRRSAKSNSLQFDCLAGGSYSVSLVSFGSQDDIRENKPFAHGLPKSFRIGLPMHSKIFHKDSVSKHDASDGSSDHDDDIDGDGAPLLNYTQLYRQFADPNDDLLSYPVHEEKPIEPTNVMY
jgi:hypothetical protein